MLNLGFASELDEIFEALPKNRQNLLFSATFPEKVIALTERVVTDPIRIKVEDRIGLIKRTVYHVIGFPRFPL